MTQAANIKITLDKNGRRLAHRWSMRALRWFRMPLDEAELLIAQGIAKRVDNEGQAA
jgi:hypothetical protein